MDTRSPATPGVSVITVVRNGAATIGRALESIVGQTHRPLESIVVDGGSSDGTLDVVRRFGDRVRCISEPDRGIYDAMNKGLTLVQAPERYVIFLNADDRFATADVVARVLAESGGEDFLYGRIERRDDPLRHRDVIGAPVTSRQLLFGMKCHHQAVLCRRRVFDEVGAFDTTYRLAADYDWVVRVFQAPGVSRRFVPIVVASMDRGGLSDRAYPDSIRERRRIVARRFPPAARLAFALYSPVGDTMRYHLQRALRPLGLLNAARALKRALLGRPTG